MENFNDIIFEEADSPETIARKTFDIHVGTSELKPQLQKLGIEYSKVVKGVHTFYCLKSKNWNNTLWIRL